MPNHPCAGLIVLLTCVLTAQGGLLFNNGSSWKYFIGTQEASTPDTSAWRAIDFNDDNWSSGAAPVGYGEPDIQTVLPSSAAGNYLSAFFRKTFVVADPADVSSLELVIRFDDGIVVWINGVEIGRDNVPAGNLAFNATASTAREPEVRTITVIDNLSTLLRTGVNVIAVQVFNGNSTSSDLLLDAALTSTEPDPIPPTVLSFNPTFGVVNDLSQVTVTFSENVAGVDAGDLRLNGIPAIALTPVADYRYRFTFEPPAHGTVTLSWNSAHGITDYGIPPNAFNAMAPGTTGQYTFVDNLPPFVEILVPPAGQTVRDLSQIEAFFSEAVTGVDADDLQINGSAATNVIPLLPNQYLFQFPQPPTGLVQVAWITGHGIQDLAAPANAFAGGNWIYTLDPKAAPEVVLITEFSATGNTTLPDEDGEYPDWIEIHNAGNVSVNLNGWYLTDDDHDLTQWRFPATTLNPGAYLVVFASGKDRTVSGRELHTNFQLDGNGEYLALVRPDGRTIAHDFEPAYPAQLSGLSYGVTFQVQTNTLLTSGNAANWHVPISADDLPANWTAPDFDDAAWDHGQSGIGFYRGSPINNYASLIATDLESPMFGVNASAFIRLPFYFNAEETPVIDELTLRIKYDDGFIAYLNGVEVARRNAPAVASWNAAATAEHASLPAVQFEDLDITPLVGLVRNGPNVLSLHGLNLAASDDDFLMLPELVARAVDVTQYRYFPSASPGAANVNSFLGLVADTKFNPDRGFYDTPMLVTVSNATPGVEIRYTLDGTLPTETHGSLYTGAIPVNRTTTLRAAAFKPGWKPSNVDSHTYIFLKDVVQQTQATTLAAGFPSTWGGTSPDYGLDPDVVGQGNDRYDGKYTASISNDLRSIPTMSIVMNIDDMFGANGIYTHSTSSGVAWERPASVEFIYPDGTKGFQENCGIRTQGGAFRNHSLTLKHSLRLLFKNIYGTSKLNFPLFGNDASDSLDSVVLRANSNDGWQWDAAGSRPLYIRDSFARHTMLDFGSVASGDTFVHLYINGVYWGLYNPVERPDHSFSATYYGGAKENWDFINTGGANNGDLNAWNTMLNLANQGLASTASYERIQGNNPDGTPNPAYPNYLDVDSMIDYMVVNLYGGNTDWPHNNWVVGRDRTDASTGFKFYLWDTEWIMDLNSSLNQDLTGASAGVAQPYAACRNNAEFRLHFADRLHRWFFNRGPLYVDPEHPQWDPAFPEHNQPAARFNLLADFIDRAIVAESARWGDQHAATPYTRDEHWEQEREYLLNNYFPYRSAIVLNQFRNAGLYPAEAAPEFNQPGGTVPAGFQLEMTHTNASGTIYFTLDGSDPRLAGGALAPSAVPYSGPLTIDGNVHVRARTRVGSNWSALCEATFSTGHDFEGLVVTELMYNPPNVGPVDGDEYEFLELKNVGSRQLDLSGLYFSAGITFAFTNGTRLAPGQFLVLVRNPEQFQAKYPGVALQGVYSGRLDNGGEKLRLSHSIAGDVLSLTYNDKLPWAMTPDGHGFSLVPVAPNVTSNLDQPSHWRASAAIGGSPGADDPAPGIAGIVINEIMTHPTAGLDFIELFNPTASPVDLTGWYLSDDARFPMKYRIPDDTWIEGGAFVVFDETEFNPAPGIDPSFSLSSAGEEVHLFSGNAGGELTGYDHGFEFGAALPDVSFGRYVNRAGEEKFPAQLGPTPREANAGPRIGPVVISEIMYRPPDLLTGDNSRDEFVELLNISSAPVALFDPLTPTNTWRLAGGVDYDFPTNRTLAPGEYLLLVNFDPLLEPTVLTAFRAQYGVAFNVQIFGSYAGKLDNSGETVSLKLPTRLVTGEVVYAVVDQVAYRDSDPWPSGADGYGLSLQRLDPAAYGDDPLNWAASIPTAASPTVLAGDSPIITGQPPSQVTPNGDDVELAVTATGSPPLRYQWRANGDTLPGETNSALHLHNVQQSQAGDYRVLVYNYAGSILSAPAILTVLRPPQIIAHPVPGTTAWPGTNVSFTVVASSPNFITYQWRHNGTDLPGATHATLDLTDVQWADDGAYTAAVSDSGGTVISEPAMLYVLIKPVIVQPPLTQTVVEGGNVTFSASISGNPPPYLFQWRYGSRILTNFILNGTTCFFTLTNVQPDQDDTFYRLAITNAASSAITGVHYEWNLTVLPDADHDGLPDAFEAAQGHPDNSMVGEQDDDGDGMTNREEYQAGTDGQDPDSYLRVEPPATTGSATLSFGAVSNRTYSVEYTDSLTGGAWVKLEDISAATSNHVAHVSDPATVPNRYYRVVTPRQP